MVSDIARPRHPRARNPNTAAARSSWRLSDTGLRRSSAFGDLSEPCLIKEEEN